MTERVVRCAIDREELSRIVAVATSLNPVAAFAIEVAWWVGLRKAELVVQTVDRDTWSRGILRVTTRPHEREIPLEDEAKALLLERAPRAGMLFPSRHADARLKEYRHIGLSTLAEVLGRAGDLARLPRKIEFTLPMLRWSCAARWIREGVPPREITNRMGHSHATTEKLIKAFAVRQDLADENTVPRLHWSEAKTQGMRRPPGFTTTVKLPPAEAERLDASVRARKRDGTVKP